eukprot:scaffold124036_cov66-Phaeocystis_antarctica.AAC.3
MEDIRYRGSTPCHSYTTSAWLRAAVRHQAASPANAACCAGAGCSAAARSQCAAASLSSAAERGPTSQHRSPHLVGYPIVRRRPHNPRRQHLEPLVVPPLRLGHLGALPTRQHVEGRCYGLCPDIRAHRVALLGLEEPLRSLHNVPRVGERCTEAVVRRGPVGPQGDGLAIGPSCFAPVLLGKVTRTLS